MRLEGRARLKGRDVNVVEGIPAKGPTEKLFFYSENGLLLRWDMVRRDKRRGNVFVKVHLELSNSPKRRANIKLETFSPAIESTTYRHVSNEDYREVDGVKVPFHIRFAFESFSLTLRMVFTP